jgi:hypothetical protein
MLKFRVIMWIHVILDDCIHSQVQSDYINYVILHNWWKWWLEKNASQLDDCLLFSMNTCHPRQGSPTGKLRTGESQMVWGTGNPAGGAVQDCPGRLWLPLVSCPALPNEPLLFSSLQPRCLVSAGESWMPGHMLLPDWQHAACPCTVPSAFAHVTCLAPFSIPLALLHWYPTYQYLHTTPCYFPILQKYPVGMKVPSVDNFQIPTQFLRMWHVFQIS